MRIKPAAPSQASVRDRGKPTRMEWPPLRWKSWGGGGSGWVRQQFSFGHVAFEKLDRNLKECVGRQREVGVDCMDYLLLGNKLLKT